MKYLPLLLLLTGCTNMPWQGSTIEEIAGGCMDKMEQGKAVTVTASEGRVARISCSVGALDD